MMRKIRERRRVRFEWLPQWIVEDFDLRQHKSGIVSIPYGTTKGS